MVDTLRAHACDVETALKQKHAHIFERAILMHDVAFAFHFGTLHRFALKAVEDVDVAVRSPFSTPTSTLASARDRLPESRHFVECGVIFGAVVRARSVHKACYGHNRDWAAAQPLLA